ncbi:MAG TPA: hypothetical protein VFX59_06440, partial [Polyangiales bacterium]|nr:hypothetical protein [Polyangiales bacterium]
MSARNVCEWSRLRFASFFALLLIVVGWSMSGAAQAGELSRPAVAALPDGPEPAQWGDVLHDTPQGEVSAIEAEADGDPVAPELPRITKPVFG